MSEDIPRLIQMEVVGLGMDEASGSTVLVLGGDGESLPMVIGLSEATSIAKALDQIELPRPVAHDLLSGLLALVGAKLRHIEVIDLRDGTYFAELVLDVADGAERRMDSRPSDAVALAIREGAPILVHEHILGKEPKEPKGFPIAADKEGWKKVLEELQPEDFKYKM